MDNHTIKYNNNGYRVLCGDVVIIESYVNSLHFPQPIPCSVCGETIENVTEIE